MRHALWILLLLQAVARADVLILDDDTRVEGKAHKEGDQWIVVDAAGHETDVPADRIVSFQLGSAETPEDRLADLRRSVANLSDLTIIIDRYDHFIAANPDSAAEAEAKSDRDLWQHRLDQNCVKVGPNWITPKQRSAMIAGEAATAAEIADMVSQGRLDDATDALNTAITNDPQDPSALYLRGVVLADEDQVAPARADFEAVNKLIPKHGPTLNNLAVMVWRQKLYAVALNDYAQAMLASPVNKAILDNVAEALNDLPDDSRNQPPVARAQAIFADQDAILRKSQAANGQFRWGATWVDANSLADLQNQEARNQVKLDGLRSEINIVESTIAADDAQLATDQQLYQRLTPNLYSTNPLGQTVLNEPSQEYLDLQSDIARLNVSRQTAAARLPGLADQARQIEGDLTIPKFTGAQHIIGPEGTPLRTGPATQAAPD